MANTEHPVTGPTLDFNGTHVPCMGGAGGIKQEAHMAEYPSKSQGRFKPAETAGELTASQDGKSRHFEHHHAQPAEEHPHDHEYFLRKEYPKHAGESAEIHGPLTSKFNGG